MSESTYSEIIDDEQLVHTPGPISHNDYFDDKEVWHLYSHSSHFPIAEVPQHRDEPLRVSIESEASARLLAAAYNSFDSAGKRLGVNAVEMAERMQESGIAEIVEALGELEDCLGTLFESGRIYYPIDDAPVIAGRLETARDILAMVKGLPI